MSWFKRKLWIPAPNPLTPISARGMNNLEGRIASAFEQAQDRPMNVFDVTQNGAKGDAVTDDTAAIQALMDAAAANTYGPYGIVLYFPPGYTFIINGTLNVPDGTMVRMIGGGKGRSVGGSNTHDKFTKLLRKAGSAGPMIQATGSGIGGSFDGVGVEVTDMWIDGGAGLGYTNNGPLISINNSSEVLLSRLRLANNDGTGLSMMTFNSKVSEVDTITCGRTTGGVPAMVISSVGGQGTNTLTFSDMRSESNNWTDVQFTGGGAAGASNITVSGWKLEGGLHLLTPYVELGQSVTNTITGLVIQSHREYPAIVQTSTMTLIENANQIRGLVIAQRIVEVPQYQIDVQAGALVVQGNMYGDPSSAHIHMGASSLAGGLMYDGMVTHPDPDGTTPYGFLKDDRP